MTATLQATHDQIDFDELHDRRRTCSNKWDKYKDQDILPLWVADMDFRSPDAVIQAMQERVSHGIFGYSSPSENLENLVLAHAANLNWKLEKRWVTWLLGIVPGLNIAARTVGEPGDHLLVTTPMYYPFLSVPDNAERGLIKVPCCLDGNRWVLDFDALDQALAQPRSSMLLFCNPHNPLGRVYSRAELERVAELVLRHDSVICSDEIHCDLLLADKAVHIPIASLDEDIAQRSITLMAPTKTFNIPGLSFSYAVIPNTELRHRFAANRLGMQPSLSPLSLTAAEAAYRYGGPWLSQLLSYLRGNAEAIHERIRSLSGVRMTPVEATCLAWIDISELGLADPVKHFEKHGLGLSGGGAFGDERYIRLNFGCPRSRLNEALDRFASAVLAC